MGGQWIGSEACRSYLDFTDGFVDKFIVQTDVSGFNEELYTHSQWELDDKDQQGADDPDSCIGDRVAQYVDEYL